MLKTTLEDAQDRLDALLTYANSVTGASDTSVGDAIETLANGYGQGGGSSLPIQLELLATWEADLEEYTGTTAEQINTTIDTSQFTDIYLLTTIECDGEYDPPTLTREWSGLSVALGGLYEDNHKYNYATTFDYRGVVRPTIFSELRSGVQANHGIRVLNNVQPMAFSRTAHATNCPRIMGGHYTVRVYAIRFN